MAIVISSIVENIKTGILYGFDNETQRVFELARRDIEPSEVSNDVMTRMLKQLSDASLEK